MKGLDHWLTTDPRDLDPFSDDLDAPDFDPVYVTCAECGHQVEDGEPCPFCEKNAETGSLDPHYGDDDAA